MSYYLTIGLVLGLSAGLSPGPLLTLVISETLQHGIRSGIKVAMAPIITDLPIIIFTFFILDKLGNFQYVLGIISLTGGCFVLYMAYQNMISKGCEVALQTEKPQSLLKGISVNILSPHPYLFWLSVGAPIITKAMNLSSAAALAFVAAFYVCLLGSKVLLAILVGKSRVFLSGNAYTYIMRFLGLALGILACVLFVDGLKLLGILEIS